MQSLTIPTGDHNPTGRTAADVLAALQGVATITEFDALAEEDGMTLVVVDQAEGHFLSLILGVDYDLRLFKNNVTSGLTTVQKDALTEASFTQATFTGYAPVTLTGGSWTITNGNPSAGVYAIQSFTSSANQTAQTIYGYYVTRHSDNKLEWFEYFASPVTIDTNGQFLSVTPRFTAQDTGD